MPSAEQRDSASPASSRPDRSPSRRGLVRAQPPQYHHPQPAGPGRSLLFWLIDSGGHWLAACVLFVVAAATDAIDGYIARRYGLVTKIGRILDPFVDKVIIGGAFVFLAVEARFAGSTPGW